MGFIPDEILKLYTQPASSSGGKVAPYRPFTRSTGKKDYDSLYEQYGKEYDVDPDLLFEQGFQESKFQDKALSLKGAYGPAQFMPDTAREFGLRVDGVIDERADPRKAIPAQARLMRKLLDRTGDIELALAGYNSGHNADVLTLKRNRSNIAETRDYVTRITGRYQGASVPSFKSFDDVMTAYSGSGVMAQTPESLDSILDQYKDTPLAQGGFITPTPEMTAEALLPPGPEVSTQPPISGSTVAPETQIPGSALRQNRITPVPEHPETVAAQIISAKDLKSPRAIVYTTDPAQNGLIANDPDQWLSVPFNQGMVHLPVSKSKKWKLKTPEDLLLYLKKNPIAFTKMMGKVDDVGNNTATGNAVHTFDPTTGRELTSSIVTNPESAAKQVAVDKASFPGSESVGMPAEDVVAKRLAENIPDPQEFARISDAPPFEGFTPPNEVGVRATEFPASSPQAPTKPQTGVPGVKQAPAPRIASKTGNVARATTETADGYQEWLDYTGKKASPEALAEYKQAVSSGGEGSVNTDVALDDSRASEVEQSWSGAEKEKSDDDILKGSEAVRVNLKGIPVTEKTSIGMRQAVSSLAKKYGATVQQVETFLANNPTPAEGDITKDAGDEIEITFDRNAIAELVGKDAVIKKYRERQKEMQTEFDMKVAQTPQGMESARQYSEELAAIERLKTKPDAGLLDEANWKAALYKGLQNPSQFLTGRVEFVTSEERQAFVDDSVRDLLKNSTAVQAEKIAKEYEQMPLDVKIIRHGWDVFNSINRFPASFAKTIAWAEDAVSYLREKGIVLPTFTTTDLFNGLNWVTGKTLGTDIKQGEVPYTIAKGIEKLYPDDPKTANTFTGKLSRAVGSAVPFLAGAVATGGSSGMIALMGIGSQVGEMYGQSKDAGLSREKNLLAGLAGIPLGATEVLGLKWAKLGQLLNSRSKGVFMKSFGKWLLETGKEIAEETPQEFFQSASGAAVIEALKNDGFTKKDIAKAIGGSLDDAFTAGIVAAIFGGGVPLATGQVQLRAPKAESQQADIPKLSREDLEAKIVEVEAKPRVKVIGEQRLDMLSGAEAEKPVSIYHGTTAEAAKAIEKSGFDVSQAADGTVWFTTDKTKIEKGEVTATGKGGLVERQIDESKLKLGGWAETDKYSTDELISQGYDGLKLPGDGEITYQIFHPEKLDKVLTEAVAPTPKISPEAKISPALQAVYEKPVRRNVIEPPRAIGGTAITSETKRRSTPTEAPLKSVADAPQSLTADFSRRLWLRTQDSFLAELDNEIRLKGRIPDPVDSGQLGDLVREKYEAISDYIGKRTSAEQAATLNTPELIELARAAREDIKDYRAGSAITEPRAVETLQRLDKLYEKLDLKNVSESVLNLLDHKYLTGAYSPSALETGVLSKVRDSESQTLLSQTLPHVHTETILSGLKGGKVAENGDFEINEYESEQIRRLLGEQHFQQTGQEIDPRSFDALTWSASAVNNLVKTGRAQITDYKRAGYTDEQLRGYNALLDGLEKSIEKSKDYAVAYVFDDALPEERVHQEDLRAGRTDAGSIVKLRNSPLWKGGAKFNQEYPGISDADRASEIAAKLATDQAEKYGWNKIKDFDQHKEQFLDTWARGILRKNNIETQEQLDTFKTKFERIGIYANLKTNNETAGTKDGGESGVSGSTSKDVRQDAEAAESGGREKSLAEPEVAEITGQTEKEVITKNRKFAESIGKTFYDIGDVEYEAQTEKGWMARSQQDIRELGVDDALRQYNGLDAKKSQGFKTALGVAIASELYANGTATEFADFGRTLTTDIGNVAQELRASQLLSRLSPEHASLIGQQLVEKAIGRDMTEDEFQKMNDKVQPHAQDLKTISDDKDFSDAVIQDYERRIENFTKAVAEMDALLKSEKERANKFEQDAEKVKAQFEAYKTKKPRKPIEKLKAEVKENRKAYQALLQNAFGDKPLMMVVWHGSPHRFDKFDSSSIGTGEGVQAYGHGLYFTDREEIADYYKNALTKGWNAPKIFTWNGRAYLPNDPDYKAFEYIHYTGLKETRQRMKEILADFDNDLVAQDLGRAFYENVLNIANTIRSAKEVKSRTGEGAKYKVDLKPAEDEYLLWDKPLSEQSEKVRTALVDGIEDAVQFKVRNNEKDWHLWDTVLEDIKDSDLDGKAIYRLLISDEVLGLTPQEASNLLYSFGIRGNKYLDGASRSKGEGNYNYVIFSDEDVEIQEILAMASSQRDSSPLNNPEILNALINLSAVKLSDELAKGVTDEHPAFTNDDFDAHLDTLSNGQLIQTEKDLIHAKAWEAITTKSSLSDEAKASLRNRSAHGRRASIVLNAEAIAKKQAEREAQKEAGKAQTAKTNEALKNKNAFKYDKFARAMVNTAQSLDMKPETVFTAFAMREFGNEQDLRREFSEQFPDSNKKDFAVAFMEARRLDGLTKTAIMDARNKAEAGKKSITLDELMREKEYNKRLAIQQRKARQNLEKLFKELSRTKIQKVLHFLEQVYNIPRALGFSSDAGFLFRQGNKAAVMHSGAWGGALKVAFPALTNKAKLDANLHELYDSDIRRLAEARGAKFKNIGEQSFAYEDWANSMFEEGFDRTTGGKAKKGVTAVSNFVTFIPRRSNMAHGAFLDALTLKIFEEANTKLEDMNKRGKISDASLKDSQEFFAQKYAPVVTGRAHGKVTKQINVDNVLDLASRIPLASARLRFSHFQFLYYMNPIRAAFLPKGARKILFQKQLRFYSPVLSIIAMGILSGLMFYDPEDAKFLKIDGNKLAEWTGFKGFKDMTIDISGGSKEAWRTAILGGEKIAYDLFGNGSEASEKKRKAVNKELYQMFITSPRFFENKYQGERVGTFWRYGMHPGLNIIDSWIDGHDAVGKPYGAPQAARDLLLPLPARQIGENITYDTPEKTQTWKDTAVRTIFSLIAEELGGGVQSYRPVQKETSVNDKLRSGDMSESDAVKTLDKQLESGEITRRQYQTRKKDLDNDAFEKKAKDLDASSDKDFDKLETFLKALPDEQVGSVREVMLQKRTNKLKDNSDKARADAQKLADLIEKYL